MDMTYKCWSCGASAAAGRPGPAAKRVDKGMQLLKSIGEPEEISIHPSISLGHSPPKSLG